MQLRSLPTLEPVRLPQGIAQPAPTRFSHFFALIRPTFWLAPIWALLCGVLTTGEIPSTLNSFLRIALAVLLVGPILSSSFHLLRSFFERDLDAINFPFKPLPTGKISPDRVVALAAFALIGGLFIAQLLGPVPFGLSAFAFLLTLILDAPPVQLRRNSWLSPLACALTTVGIPWILGQSLFASLSIPSLVIPGIFAFGYIGIDLFFALPHIEHDRRVEIRSLVAVFGKEVGIGIAALLIDTALLGATILCLGSQNLVISGFLLTTLILQVSLQVALFATLGKNEKNWHLPIASVLFGVAMMLAAAASCLAPTILL
ncbi:MAG TPA: UbiA family prenyltransferase [Chroococcales cyanobacterium]